MLGRGPGRDQPCPPPPTLSPCRVLQMLRENLEEEATVMKDVPGWKVGPQPPRVQAAAETQPPTENLGLWGSGARRGRLFRVEAQGLPGLVGSQQAHETHLYPFIPTGG